MNRVLFIFGLFIIFHPVFGLDVGPTRQEVATKLNQQMDLPAREISHDISDYVVVRSSFCSEFWRLPAPLREENILPYKVNPYGMSSKFTDIYESFRGYEVVFNNKTVAQLTYGKAKQGVLISRSNFFSRFFPGVQI